MPIRHVEITDALDRFIEADVASGHYQDASDVMREALRTLELQRQDDEDKLAALRAAIAEGDASGIFEGDAWADAGLDVKEQ
jgi:antitoxin ParD1/3/4